MTVVYRSDYTGEWRTCLKVGGLYVRSTDIGHDSERQARDAAACRTGDDNGRGLEVAGRAELDWIRAGATLAYTGEES